MSTSSASSISVNLSGLANQTYVDLATGNQYTLNGSSKTITLTNGCALLVPTFLKDELPEIEESYSSSIVIQNAPTNKSYFVWHWMDGSSGTWRAFENDLDAIGTNLNNNENYIIVEANSGYTVSTISWGSVLRQTNDLRFNGTQTIINYNDIVWKS